MKKKLLISLPSQFGYHTDTYMYCKYLNKEKYEVNYIGFDTNKPKFSIADVHVHYIPLHSNKVKRYWTYLKKINKLIRKEKFDLIFQVDHKLTLLVRLCNLNKRFILDIRTGSLNESAFKRNWLNKYIWFTALFYKHITIISDSLRKLLNIPQTKADILPLGAEYRFFEKKSWNTFNLFYIGTFQKRHIHETIEGFALFKKKHPEIYIHYDIVGNGTNIDMDNIEDSINNHHLDDYVTLHGSKKHDQIENIWQKANIGIVYVPQTPYYDYQPSTKLYEYALSGMVLIATNTYENKKEMTLDVGVLINDNVKSFYEGLEIILKNRNKYDSANIYSKFRKSTWENIVKTRLEPILDNQLK